MKELLAPLSRGSALFDDGNGEETGVLGEFASESLAGGVERAAAGWELPIGSCTHFPDSGNPSASAPVTGKSQIDTGMSARK